MMFYIRLLIKNIKCNKLKYIIIISGMIASVFLLFSILTLSESFKTSLYNEMKISDEKVLTIALGDRANTINHKYLPVFDENTLQVVKSDENITSVVGVYGFGANINYFDTELKTSTLMPTTIVYSSEEEYLTLFDIKINTGVFCDAPNLALVGSSIAKAFETELGDKLIIDTINGKVEVTIVGILDGQKPQEFSSTPSMINNLILLNTENELVVGRNYIFLAALVDDVANIENTIKRLEYQLNSHENLNSMIEKTLLNVVVISRLDVLKTIDSWFVYINLFIGLFSIIISIIVVLNLSNLMVLTITQRKKEIGVLKILGGSNRQVSKLYFIECLFLGGVGTVVGLLISFVIGYFITSQLNWVYNIELRQILFIILITVGSPLLSGFLTQLQIKKMSVMAAFTSD